MKPSVENITIVLVVVLALGCANEPAAQAQPATPAADRSLIPVIPYPQSVTMDGGRFALTAQARLVTTDEKLAPLAAAFQGELLHVTGLKLALAAAPARAGDIVLGTDPAAKPGGYCLRVADQAVVGAGDYKGAAAGTATILQALDVKGDAVSLPRMTVVDAPHADYCAAMEDVARKPHTLEQLRQCVDVCRLYKIRYFALHMTDDQLWTFPSTKYPQLGAAMADGQPQRFDLEGLKRLVAYADARGVTIVPEIEMPGHCGAAAGAMPEVFNAKDAKTGQSKRLGIMNITDPKVYAVMKDILTEVAQVFASSPYIHLGGDETDFGVLETDPDCLAAMKKMGMNTPQLFCHFLSEMSNHVKSLGKRAIVWEGFERGGDVPKHTIVMAWRNWYYRCDELVADGYTIINCPWWLGCEWDDWTMYMSNFIWLKKTDPVLGSTLVHWEQPGPDAVPALRGGIPWRMERTWNISTARKSDDLKARLAHTDKVLDRLLTRLTFAAQGTTAPDGTSFHDKARLELVPSVKTDTIRYTLDGAEPTEKSPAYAAPIELTDTTRVKARAFDEAGKPAGVVWDRAFDCQPFEIAKEEGLISKAFGGKFGDRVTVHLQSFVPGTIRYTLDDKEPTANSPAYDKPISSDKTLTIKARFFDPAGKPRGYTPLWHYPKVDYEKNLTTGKPAKASSTGWQEKVEYAVDGVVEVMDFESTYWASGPAPQWLQVDLLKTHRLGEAVLYTYFGDGRYYQYVIEVSTDEKTWTKVADGSANTAPATAKGYRHAFSPAEARYIRVTMLKNSANQGQHIVELRAYEAK
ncbi:MAG: family 20 glycosylhydrolase [Planctomycetota bacterium]|nr:family 20 glycosylhydrolase [Planctomycetota bacterium]